MLNKGSIAVSVLAISVLFVFVTLNAQEPQQSVNWQHWEFLLGEWVGEGGANATDQATGASKFYLDLDSTILIRESYADYPASNERPAYSHKDKMIIFQQSSTTKAIYFDNEGHVIDYDVRFSDDFDTVTFVSEISPDAPRFRLTYTREKEERLKLEFEIAPPGKPESFSPYLTATMKRK